MDIPIYVLNHNDEERKKRMRKRFKNYNINFLKTINIDPNKHNISNELARNWSIILSHFENIKHFYYMTDANNAIFCEDDVYIHNDFNNKLINILSDFKKLDLDILLLSYLLPFHPKNNGNLIIKNNNNEYYTYSDDTWGAHMYLISRPYAIYLLNKFTIEWAKYYSDKPYVSDWIITKNGNRALVWPPLGVEEGNVKCNDIMQIEYHKECKEFLYNDYYADSNNDNKIKYDLVIDYENMNLFGTGRYGDPNAGFFCQCSVLFTSIIQYYKMNGKWPNKIDASQQFEIYKPINKKHKDIFEDIFKINYEIVSMNPHVYFHPDFHYGNYWEFGEANWDIYAKPISRYFNPSDTIQSIIDEFIKKYDINFMNTCAIYYRGTDKITEQELLSFKYIENRMETIKKTNSDIKFLVQSDQKEFINKMKEKYSDILFIEENMTITGNTGIHNTFKDDENYKILLNFVATMFIMKDCSYVITGSGNCCLWLALLRSNTLGYTNFFQYKNDIETPINIYEKELINSFNIDNYYSILKSNWNIPKNIFQTWETKKIGNKLLAFSDSWRLNNLDFEYNLFDKNEREQFIKLNFDSKVYDTYMRIKPGAYKADLWRYCILYKKGGYYADIDTLCINSIQMIIPKNIDFVSVIDISIEEYNIANGFIGCIPEHPILLDCIQRICNYVENNEFPHSMKFSGPGCLGMALNKYLNLPEEETNRGKEGFITDNILLLKFEPQTEYIKNIDGTILFQNKNGNSDIINAYKEECDKLENYIDWGHNEPFIKK